MEPQKAPPAPLLGKDHQFGSASLGMASRAPDPAAPSPVLAFCSSPVLVLSSALSRSSSCASLFWRKAISVCAQSNRTCHASSANGPELGIVAPMGHGAQLCFVHPRLYMAPALGKASTRPITPQLPHRFKHVLSCWECWVSTSSPLGQKACCLPIQPTNKICRTIEQIVLERTFKDHQAPTPLP